MVVPLDDPQRQSPSRERGWDQGRRASGTFCVDGVDNGSTLFGALRPEGRVAVKPHTSPIFHAMHYLMDNIIREKIEDFLDDLGLFQNTHDLYGAISCLLKKNSLRLLCQEDFTC